LCTINSPSCIDNFKKVNLLEKKMKCITSSIILSFILLLHSTIAIAKPIVVGLDADMSAVAIEGGIAIKRGAQIAIDEINAAGGVLGRKLKLEVRDHRGNPARGLANINYFGGKDDVVAVLGGVHTPVALHELEAIHQHKMIYLGPWAAGTLIVKNGYSPNYVFRLSVRDEHAGKVLLKYAYEKKIKRVGLLLERTGWGRSNEVSMGAAAKKYNISIEKTEWFNWRAKSVKNQMDNLIEAGVEAILLVANAPEGVTVVKELASRSKSNRVPIISHWGIASGTFVKNTGLDTLAKVDVSVLQTYSFLKPTNDIKMQKLLSAYKTTFDTNVTPENLPAQVGVVHAYDLIHLLAIAINKAGTTDREIVRNAFEKIEIYRGVTKLFKQPFTPKRHDALMPDDYIVSKYNDKGYLVPIE
jgi:branched-chain amino acid transport system substrate-binding protein